MNEVKAASDIMRRNLVTLTPECDVMDSVARLLRDNISGAPVLGADGGYLAVFSEKCCMNALTEPVETARAEGLHITRVREFMVSKLVTINPDMDVFDAIDHLLSRRISGAPVVDSRGHYLGIFSEKTAMRALIAALHDQLPGTSVNQYMNLDRNRIIHEDDSLLDIAHKFQETPYRRLPVLQGERLAGQVSRRDVLRAECRLACEVVERAKSNHASDNLRRAAQPRQIGPYMDTEALTASPSTDLLGITQMFLNSPYRRLPIVEEGRLLGQVSRRDLLEAAAELLRPKPERRGAETLYLSLVSSTAPESFRR
ncbi:CBS domain-containing protein [Novipirellula rosea]|uniref:CBS domain-containing protein n=1 Tax=Novipirellula rosea TaxID=1031540 RepID=A0ABP8M7P7_9BACT